jgi:hypothetical protein
VLVRWDGAGICRPEKLPLESEGHVRVCGAVGRRHRVATLFQSHSWSCCVAAVVAATAAAAAKGRVVNGAGGLDLLVRGSDLVLNGSARFGPTPDPEPDRRSGSAPTPDPGPNFGPVRGGSGPDQSSEPNCGNTNWMKTQYS